MFSSRMEWQCNQRELVACMVILLCTILPIAAPFAIAAEGDAGSTAFAVASPNGRVRVDLFVRETATAPAQLHYRISLSDRPVVLASALVIRLANGISLGSDCMIDNCKLQYIDAYFEQFPGKRRHVSDRCTEATLSLRQRVVPGRIWQVIVRAYDDGVAVRYRFPQQEGWQRLELAEEHTEFKFPPDALATALPLASFTTSHENRYQRQLIADMTAKSLIGLPMLVELPGTGWAAVTEANLANYAGMYLTKENITNDLESQTTFVSRLSPRVGEPAIAVRARLPHETPWRVIILGKKAGQLIESDLVLKLNAPCALRDLTWIKPGQTTFPWWNGYFEEDVPFAPGLNTATAKHYIDFCAEYEIPYHTLDGLGNIAWYGGPITPYAGDNPTTAVAGLDLSAVLAYAKRKGVRLRVWMHWQAARDHMARAFPLYRGWGIEGVMIDFMDRNDQEMVNFQRELLQLAADNRLTVTLHGVAPPTGLERTYPNLLSSEAVLNLEYDKWDERGVSPEHDVEVPVTRMLAGPLDYHQGSLRTVALADFRPQNVAPLVIGTPCRTLASYVVLQNHLPMVADYPTAYRTHPLTHLLVRIPATWDDTRALAANVGEIAAIARRSGEDWWIGAITNRAARELSIPLNFLGPGQYRAAVYSDDLVAPHQFAESTRNVTSTDVLPIRLAPAGGTLIRLSRLADLPPPGWRLVWSDDFDTFDGERWERTTSFKPTSNSKHACLPDQAWVSAGELAILSENKPAEGLPYRSGQVVSLRSQRLGRWEVRARIPTTRGIWPTIRLLPDAPWPSKGEIDIMENRGDKPTITSSAFHWGTSTPFSHANRAVEQQMSLRGELVSFPDGFHTYAVDWLDDQLRFYVDDVHHTTFYNDEVGDFLPRLTTPMRLVISTAIGGDYLPPPDETTIWPQRFLVDWVRVYEPADTPGKRRFLNGDFEANGGTLAGWHVFGNQLDGDPNVLVHNEVAKKGKTSLKLSGQSSGSENYSGVSQGISVRSGQRLRASLAALVRADHSLANTNSQAVMKVEFYNHWGDYFGGPAMLGFEERTIAEGSTPCDIWQVHELIADVPEGAIEARLSIVFAQHSNHSGAVYCDAVEFARDDN